MRPNPFRPSRSFPPLFLRVLLLALLSVSLPAAPLEAEEPTGYARGEILVGWEPARSAIPLTPPAAGKLDEDRTSAAWQAAAAALEQATGLQVIDAQPRFGYARLAVRPGQEQRQIARLQELDWVKYAEPNYIARAAGAFYPNDLGLGRQWNMRRVDAPQAWSITQGSLSFVVATLDTGVDRGHPDLAGRLLPGRNYVSDVNYYPDDDSFDSHGTHVAGIIAANTNNAAGVAGMAGQVKVLPLKVLDQDGAGYYSDIADGIRYAADYGAQVINMSLAGTADSNVMSDAVYHALGRGALIVAAAGNCASAGEGCPLANPTAFPAAYPGVLAVAASDHYDRWAPYSGHKSYIGIAAPGGATSDAVWSTVRGGYGYLYGTSMATPLVAGAAALVWTLVPAASYSEITWLLESTADKVGTDPASGQPLPYPGGRNDYFGFGRLNVGRAVRSALAPSLTPEAASLSFYSMGGPAQSRTLRLVNPSDQAVSWQAEVIYGGAWLSLPAGSGVAWSAAPGELPIVVGPRPGLSWPPPGANYGMVRLNASGLPSTDILVVLEMLQQQPRSASLPFAGSSAFSTAWQDPNSPEVLSRTPLYLADDQLVQKTLPFPVGFYGAVYSSLYISDNGYVVFGQPQPGSQRAPSTCLRTADAPNSAIYVNAADWEPALGGQTYVHRPDASTFVVTWEGARMTGSSLPQSFQLVFYRDGPIRAIYRQVEQGSTGIVGTEYFDGTVAEEIYCQGVGRAPRSGEGLQFSRVLPW